MNHKRHYDDGLQLAPTEQAGLETNRDGLQVAETEFHPENKQTSAKLGNRGTVRQQNKLCGLKPTTLWLGLIIIFLIVAVAAIGGGVGGALASKKPATTVAAAQSSTNAPAPSLTVSRSSPSSVTSSATSATAIANAYACTKNGSTYTASTNTLFTVFCNTDVKVGPQYNSTATVLIDFLVNSFGACLDACAVSNSIGVFYSASGYCQSATWISAGSTFGTCWLRNATVLVNGTNGHYSPNNPDKQTGSLQQGQ